VIGLSHYLTVAAILFTIGVLGIFLNRRNVILMLMAIELILLAVNINLVAFSAFLGVADDSSIDDAGLRQQHPLDIFGKDVQPFRRDDHFLLAAANVDTAVLVDAADVAGVQPAVFQRCRREHPVLQVAARDVLATNEDLAIGRELHLHAWYRLADRALPG
jgi:hypothetical protein